MTQQPGHTVEDTTGAEGTRDDDAPAPAAGGDGSGADRDGGGDGGDARGGLDGPTEEEAEEERARRLDPENRPDGAEVDNTSRDFDVQKGMFTDAEGYDRAEEVFPPAAEQDT